MIVVSDLEGTLTDGATWRGTGNYLKQHRSALAYSLFFISRAPVIPLARLNLIDQQHAKNRWLEDLLRLFTHATPDEVEHMGEWVVEHEMWPKRRRDVLDELEAHRRAGARIIVASGTYQPVAEAFARRIGAEVLASPLEVADGRVRVVGGLSVQETKARRVRAYLDGAAVDHAYGDTASDVPLLELAAHPVAVCPDAGLRRVAEARGWRILEPD
jgi:HAD superfamily phosphoserine phosphatase-like hydrolase